jgi:hypothetical protein
MNSEVKLNQLFEALKSERTTTEISDVASWIHTAALGNATPKTNENSIQKHNTMVDQLKGIARFNTPLDLSAYWNVKSLFTTVVSAALIGSMFVLSDNDEPMHVSEPQKGSASIVLDTTTNSQNQQSKPSSSFLSPQPDLIQSSADSSSELPLLLALENQPAIEPFVPIPSFDFSYSDLPKTETGFWKSMEDHLQVDTTFNGITSIVLVGDKCDIAIHGNSGTDVTIKYDYHLKAKGLFSRNKDGHCKLSYEINNSVLTLHVKRSNQSYSGISTLDESSSIDMHIPEGIDVRMDSDLGDIAAEGLKGKTIKLHSSLGDITAQNCSGNFDLNTALGDISLNDVKGKITSNTDMGDITGENITITEACTLTTSLGDIDVQLTNSLSECRLDLSTSLGNVKVDRPELTEKSHDRLKIGTGKLKVIMNTSLGKIKVR